MGGALYATSVRSPKPRYTRPVTLDPTRHVLEDGGLLLYYESWLSPAEARDAFEELRRETPWKSESIRIAGRLIPVPRLTAWVGDPEAVYTYSGVRNEPSPWTPRLADLRERASAAASAPLNSVLLNYYRNGRDSMGWHADDERELGKNPVIASLSLGAPRRFLLRHEKKRGKSISLVLGDGSLLVMAGATQHHYRHAVPKEDDSGERINLTFRRVFG
jgi:alkylated DNA repair dioxygenase AlkB